MKVHKMARRISLILNDTVTHEVPLAEKLPKELKLLVARLVGGTPLVSSAGS